MNLLSPTPPPRSVKRYRRAAEKHRCPITKKLGFKTKRKAQRAAHRSAESSGKPIQVYRCPLCDYFHLTSQVGQVVA